MVFPAVHMSWFFWLPRNDDNTKLILRYTSRPRQNLIKKRKTARKDQISPKHLPPHP